MSIKSIVKISIALGAGGALALAMPLAASAHVTVSPNITSAGSDALITINVPNESATAATNKLQLSIPADTPFSEVSYVPVAGWTTQLISTKLPKPVKLDGNEITNAVTDVVWTAEPGHEIVSGQLQTFQLSVGPVPDTGRIVLPVLQSYTDGSVVKWVETGTNPEHPAPVLYVNDTPPAAEHSASLTASAAPAPAQGASGSQADSGNDPLARGMGLAGLVLGAVGVVLAVASRRRRVSNGHDQAR